MTRAESILASRLLDVAAVQFDEHGCNDMDLEYFEDLSGAEIDELAVGFNNWQRETCGDPDDEPTPFRSIGDHMWMAYLAAVIGRPDSVTRSPLPPVADKT